MADSAHGLCQLVEIMETSVIALKLRNIFGPRCKDEQRACRTGFEAAAFGLPISANGSGLQVYESQFLLQSHVLDTFLALGDAWCHQHIAAVGGSEQTLAFCLPKASVLRRNAVGAAMEKDLMLLWLAQEKHVAKGTVAHAADGDAQGTLEKVGIFASHHEAKRVVAEVTLPVLELTVAHEDVIVVVRLEEGRAGRGGRACG